MAGKGDDYDNDNDNDNDDDDEESSRMVLWQFWLSLFHQYFS